MAKYFEDILEFKWIWKPHIKLPLIRGLMIAALSLFILLAVIDFSKLRSLVLPMAYQESNFQWC